MHKDHATVLSFHSKQFWQARVFFIIYNMSDVEKFSKILTANCLLCVLNDLRRNCKYMLNLNGPRTKMVIRVACVESVSARVHRESWNAREQKLDWPNAYYTGYHPCGWIVGCWMYSSRVMGSWFELSNGVRRWISSCRQVWTTALVWLTWPHSRSGPILAASIHFLFRGRFAFPDREILFKKRKS